MKLKCKQYNSRKKKKKKWSSLWSKYASI